MEFSRQEYPALLASLEPIQAVSVLNDRVRLINKINSDIADWLLERRRVEEAYVRDLRQLARRPQQDSAVSLGIFHLPWQRILSTTESLAQSHETLAQKLEIDVENPLRQFASKNREMQAMTTIQGNLTSLAKDVENAQKKVEKLKDKGVRPDKYAGSNSSLEEARQQWNTQAPYVFEKLQSLDETRVNHLRDVLTQFQTHEVDQVERNRTDAEACLNALLNIETADEIKTFAVRVSEGGSIVPRRQSSIASNVRPLSSGMASPPIPPPSRVMSSRTSGSSRQPTDDDRLATLPEKPAHRHSTLGGGIRRLGTVVGRRKNAAPPPVPTADKKKEKSRFPFRRGEGDSSRSFQEVEPSTTGQELTPTTSREEISSSQRFQLPTENIDTNGRLSLDAIQQGATQQIPITNGTQNASPAAILSAGRMTARTPTRNQSSDQELYEADASPGMSPPSPVQAQHSSIDAITRAQQEAAVANAENEDSLRNLTIRDQPIREDETEAKQAMSDMANHLRLQAQSSGINRVQGSTRGRRDVRNSVFVPEPVDENFVATKTSPTDLPPVVTAPAISSAAMANLASPIQRSGTPGTIPEDHRGSDTTSIHSSHSLTGLAHHPELHESGLNASIIETVSTWFSEGNISKSVVVGEVAFAYNPTDGDTGAWSTPGSETIRLENFHLLDKVAANPNFVTPAVSEKGKQKAGPEDGTGEYSVSLSAIKRPAPTVGFKYQLHIDEARLASYSPVLLTPAWQIQDSQASVIIMYAPNPAFGNPSGAPLTLKNVVLTVALDSSAESGKATSAMMAPTAGASFRRKQSLVVWKLPELVIEAEPKRLLARFVTSGPPAKAGNVEAKWELPSIVGSGLAVSSVAAIAKEASDPFADEGVAATPARTWNEVPCARKLVSGRYSAS